MLPHPSWRVEFGSDGVEFEADVCIDGVDEGTKAG